MTRYYGRFSENNLQFFWDTINNILNIGGTTTPSAKLSIRGSAGLGLLNVASSTGSSFFYISNGGNVGIATTTPSEKFEVIGNAKFAGSVQASTLSILATSTMTGPVGIGNTNPKSVLDVSGAMYSRLVTDTGASSVGIDWNLGNVHTLTLSGVTTLSFANGQAGGEYTLILNQDTAGGRTIVWPASVKWPSGIAPVLTSAANSVDTVRFIFDGANYLGFYNLNYQVPSVAAIAYDNSAYPGQSSGSPASGSFSITVGNAANRVAIVGIETAVTIPDQMTVTFGGAPMTYYGHVSQGISDIQIFYLANPASGSQEVVWSQGATAASYVNPFALVYSGVSQISPIESSSSGWAVGSSSGSLSVTGTTISNNDWGVLFGLSEQVVIYAASNLISRQGIGSSQYGVGDSNGPISPAGSYTQTFAAPLQSSGDILGYAIYLKPAS